MGFVLYFLVDSRSGKSYLFAKIAQDTNKKGNRCLILAHRNSLILQHKELFDKLDVTNEMTRIESVFTEVRHLGEHEKPALIIIDERTFITELLLIKRFVNIMVAK